MGVRGVAEKGKADMSVAAKKAWVTRRKLYGEKGLKQQPSDEQKVEQPEKSSNKEPSKKSRKTCKPEQPAETKTD
jgi:hypothetical protein